MGKNQDVVTIDIQPFIMPLAIVFSTIIFSLSFLGGMVILANGMDGNGGSNSGSSASGTRDLEVADSGEGLTVQDLAETIGVNLDDFNTCVEEGRYIAEIENDTAQGGEAGITGTPGFVVGRVVNGNSVEGYRISGALPADVFEGIINGLKDNDQAAVDAVVAEYSDYIFEDATVGFDDDPILGDSDADFVIVEFSDLECPFCQRHHNEVYPTLKENLVDSGVAMYIFRDFPLNFHEPKATESANAAQCINELAGAQGYYEFLDLYFENTKSNGEGL